MRNVCLRIWIADSSAYRIWHISFSIRKPSCDQRSNYCDFEEFENKTVGLLAVAGGSFPITALEHLRSVCRALNCWVIPHQAAVPQARTVVEDGTITDDGIADRIDKLGGQAVQYATIEPDPACMESMENVGADD